MYAARYLSFADRLLIAGFRVRFVAIVPALFTLAARCCSTATSPTRTRCSTS